MIIDKLYHWAPTERRDSILKEGLKVYSKPVTHSGDLSYPYLCFSPDPCNAWCLSGGVEWCEEFEQWDLWQMTVAKIDEIHVLPNWGSEVREIRTRNSIPADRLWWVGMREPFFAKEKS